MEHEGLTEGVIFRNPDSRTLQASPGVGCLERFSHERKTRGLRRRRDIECASRMLGLVQRSLDEQQRNSNLLFEIARILSAAPQAHVSFKPSHIVKCG